MAVWPPPTTSTWPVMQDEASLARNSAGLPPGRLLDVDDLDLRLDDEHARIHGKGGTVRTVLLDDRGYAALLRLYLARAGYAHGPLFRASINGSGGPLSYDAAHHRWRTYCTAAGVSIGIHQLRHAHATELINSGVSIEAVRRRLGHASTETTLSGSNTRSWR
jgi:integrase/recombinase XerD